MELWTNYLNQEGIPHRDGILGKKNRTLLWRETHLSTLIGFHTHLWDSHEPVVLYESHFATINLAHEMEMKDFPRIFHRTIAKIGKRSLASHQPKPKIWLSNEHIKKLHKTGGNTFCLDEHISWWAVTIQLEYQSQAWNFGNFGNFREFHQLPPAVSSSLLIRLQSSWYLSWLALSETFEYRKSYVRR